MDEAAAILEEVFRACGQKPNSVPVEALSAYAVYRRERFGLQRGMIIALLVLFFLLPILFIAPDFKVEAQAPGERRLPIYVIDAESLLPVSRVTASVQGQALPVYEAGEKTFTVEPTRNGTMEIQVTSLNLQRRTRRVEVSDVDNRAPELISSEISDGRVFLYVNEPDSGLHLGRVYGITATGEKVLPEHTDDVKQMIVFPYPKEDMDVYIPDHVGNILHLRLKRKQFE